MDVKWVVEGHIVNLLPHPLGLPRQFMIDDEIWLHMETLMHRRPLFFFFNQLFENLPLRDINPRVTSVYIPHNNRFLTIAPIYNQKLFAFNITLRKYKGSIHHTDIFLPQCMAKIMIPISTQCKSFLENQPNRQRQI